MLTLSRNILVVLGLEDEYWGQGLGAGFEARRRLKERCKRGLVRVGEGKVQRPRCKAGTWGTGHHVRYFPHMRKPPRNAFSLFPNRAPAGSFFNFLQFPPPSTT